MLKRIGRLRKQKRLLAVNRKQNFVVQFGGCTMSFGKGEFLSVEKVHKIKIAVARSVAAVRRLEVGCPVKEFFLRCLRYIPEVDAYRVDVIRVTNFDIALCKQL